MKNVKGNSNEMQKGNMKTATGLSFNTRARKTCAEFQDMTMNGKIVPKVGSTNHRRKRATKLVMMNILLCLVLMSR